MNVRAATRADAEAIAAIERDAAPAPWTGAAVRGSLELPTTRAWVCAHEGAVIGHLLTAAVGDTGEVLILATHPDHRRRGVARRLLDEAAACWQVEGVVEAFLEVRADNAPARALYAAAGWREVGRRRAYYRDGEDAVLLRWDAAPENR